MKSNLIKAFIGALIGGAVGYFVVFRLIGCSGGACLITANPYVSTAYSAIIGILLAVAISKPAKKIDFQATERTPVKNDTVSDGGKNENLK